MIPKEGIGDIRYNQSSHEQGPILSFFDKSEEIKSGIVNSVAAYYYTDSGRINVMKIFFSDSEISNKAIDYVFDLYDAELGSEIQRIALNDNELTQVYYYMPEVLRGRAEVVFWNNHNYFTYIIAENIEHEEFMEFVEWFYGQTL